MRGLTRKCVSTVDCLPRPQIWIGPEPQVAQQGTSGAIANENAEDDDLCRHALASVQGPLASSRDPYLAPMHLEVINKTPSRAGKLKLVLVSL